MALLGWVRVAAHWGSKISNASPENLQPERVISGSCNYSLGYLSSNPTSGPSVVLGSTSSLAYLND